MKNVIQGGNNEESLQEWKEVIVGQFLEKGANL